MKRIAGGTAVLFAMLITAVPAAAQERPKTERPAKSLEAAVAESGIVPALEAVAATAAPELERAAGQLVNTLGELLRNLAEDPELRTSAARAGRGVAEAAELAVVEHSATITEALRAMAERLEAIVTERERRRY